VKISSALLDVHRLSVETAPFIYFVEQNLTYLDRVRAIFQRLAKGDLEIVTSAITLTEVLVMPFQTGHTQYEREYREMLLNTEHISVVPVMPAVAIQAAKLRAKYRLRTPDALHIASAIESQADAFLTNDLLLRRVTELKVLVLEDLEVDKLPER